MLLKPNSLLGFISYAAQRAYSTPVQSSGLSNNYSIKCNGLDHFINSVNNNIPESKKGLN